jgi:predicted dehydrogenase
VTVGVALVGCGSWGLNYLRAFSELEAVRIVGACDISPERLREAERRVPAMRTTGDVAGLLTDSSVDAVVVATEATAHYQTVCAVLEAGKDCLVEKPMTTDVAQARRLRDLAQAGGRILMVGHVFYYNPAISLVRQLLNSGAIGDLQYLYFTRTNLGPIRSDVNVVWDLMTHDVSIVLHLMNQTPEWVSAQGGSFLRTGVEDVAFATLGFGSGVIANIRASWLDPRKVREITLVGTSKMIFFDDLESSEPVRIYDKGASREPSYQNFGEFKLVTRRGDVVSPAVPPTEPLKNQCQAFLQSVASRRPPLSDANDGLRVVEILAAINKSIHQRGAPVTLQIAAEEAA